MFLIATGTAKRENISLGFPEDKKIKIFIIKNISQNMWTLLQSFINTKLNSYQIPRNCSQSKTTIKKKIISNVVTLLKPIIWFNKESFLSQNEIFSVTSKFFFLIDNFYYVLEEISNFFFFARNMAILLFTQTPNTHQQRIFKESKIIFAYAIVALARFMSSYLNFDKFSTERAVHVDGNVFNVFFLRNFLLFCSMY